MEKNTLIAACILVFIGCGATYWIKNSKKEELPAPNWNQHEQAPEPEAKPEELKPETKPDTHSIGSPANYSEALKLSEKTGKKVFVYFSATWCAACREMTATFDDPVVKTALNEYIKYELNVDKEKEIARKYKIPSIPHYIIIDANERKYNEGNGKKNPEQFIRWIRK